MKQTSEQGEEDDDVIFVEVSAKRPHSPSTPSAPNLKPLTKSAPAGSKVIKIPVSSHVGNFHSVPHTETDQAVLIALETAANQSINRSHTSDQLDGFFPIQNYPRQQGFRLLTA